MSKLWQIGKNVLHPVVEAFETGDDLVVDQKLVKYDSLGSIAQAKMLGTIGILSKPEVARLTKALLVIIDLDQKGKFILKPGDEDVHTAIENYLVKHCGQVGKKIHAGRSRNDQVLTAVRLYAKEHLQLIVSAGQTLITSFNDFAHKYKTIKMPGYTHMQKAMPSTVGIWADSFSSSLRDDIKLLQSIYQLIDQSPLGSAAGYGSPLPVDKKLSARLLGFSRVQENPLYCQNSRGKFEAAIVGGLIQILLTLNKFATDVMLFSTSEFGFLNVDSSVTTGSSIMPQKKNVDVAELLRSKVHLVLGFYTGLVGLSSNLPCGFNRDMQDSKKPLMESFVITLSSLQVSKVLLENISPNKKKLKTAMTPELFAAHDALSLVQKGTSFRDAYRQVKQRFR